MVTLTALRTAVRLRLVEDATLVALLGGPHVLHRFSRERIEVPSVSYYDATTWPTPLIPRMETSFTLDVWARDLDQATAIAARCRTLLDQRESREAGLEPIPVPGGEVNIAALALADERDVPDPEPSLRRVQLRFSAVAFALVGA